MNEQRRIGILTSGGDCPGLNAILYAVLKYSRDFGWNVFGISNGTDGFIDVAQNRAQPEDFKLDEHSFDIPGQKGMGVLLFLSGSVLGCRGKKERAIQEDELICLGYRMMQLDALIAIGGDGSLDIISDLAKRDNWNLVAIPKTIDNDVPGTERVVGFDTAVEVVSDALYNLTFTAASHDRVMIVQVMGRNAGHLALHAGIAGGSDVILFPELVPTITDAVIRNICLKIAHIRQHKRKFALIAVAEGVKGENYIGPIAEYLKAKIKEYTLKNHLAGEPEFYGLGEIGEMRVTILGHLTRSNQPTASDRLLATAFGIKAIDVIARETGNFQKLLILKEGEVRDCPLLTVTTDLKRAKEQNLCSSPVNLDGFLVHVARSLGIYLGD